MDRRSRTLMESKRDSMRRIRRRWIGERYNMNGVENGEDRRKSPGSC